MKSLLSPLALLAALVMTLSGCARTIPPPTSAESASPSAPTVETSDEKPDKLPDDSQSESTAQLTEAAASPQLCAYLPVSSLPEDAAAALDAPSLTARRIMVSRSSSEASASGM